MRYLVHDIETIPESEVALEWKPTEEEIKKAHGDPFPPVWAHRVITIGMVLLDHDMKLIKAGCAMGGLVEKATEKQMVQRWNEVASGKHGGGNERAKLVDFNGRSFDVPVLQYRAFRYGIDMDWYFGKVADMKGGISSFSKNYRDRYGNHHLDLTELFTNSGGFTKPPLKILAKLMGLPGKVGFDGSLVYQAWKEGRYQDIDTYVMQDTLQTAFVFMRYKLMSGEADMTYYRPAVEKLLEWVCGRPEHADFYARIDKDRLLLSGERE